MAFLDPIACHDMAICDRRQSCAPNGQGAPLAAWHMLVAGTAVMTPDGPRPVEAIATGDSIISADHGAQVVHDIRHDRMTRLSLIAAPRLTPVRIGAGALGPGLPDRTVWLHPGTPILTGSDAGRPRRAMDLVGDSDVMRVFPDQITFVALRLPAASAIQAAGLWLGAQQDAFCL
ncbi:MAG: Hint domain-containing protein [Pseudomonadota bacterium]